MTETIETDQTTEPTITETNTSGLDDLTSFDDLTPKKFNKIATAPKEDVNEFDNLKSEVLEDKEKKNDSKEKSEPKQEKTDTKNIAEKTDEEKEVKEEKKTKLISVKDGDNELSLSLDAKIPTKIDGEIEEPTLRDLQSQYSGKIHLDREFTKLSKEKEFLQAQTEQAFNALKQISDSVMVDKNPLAVLDFVAELTGINPIQFRNEFKEQIKQAALAEAQLTPEETLRKQLEDERSYYKSVQEKQLQKQQEAQKFEQMKIAAKNAMTKYEISPDDYMSAFNEMREAGQFDPNLGIEENAERVAMFSLDKTATNLVSNEIRKYISEGNIEKDIATLKNIWYSDSEITFDDIKQSIKETYDKKTEEASKKKKANLVLSKKVGSDESRTNQTSPWDNVNTFDDLSMLRFK